MALCDTGPLVALLDEHDAAHEECVVNLEQYSGKLIVSWPVLTEAFYLLDERLHKQRLWKWIESGGLRVLDIPGPALPRMRQLMEKYADLPMDLADASLVVLAEKLEIRSVFTLDHRHFNLYRPRHARSFEIFP